MREATEALVIAAEANPDLWFRNNLTGSGNSLYIDQLIAAREALAKYIHAPLNETAIVDNASHGINAVLRSVPAFLAKNRYGLPDTLPLSWPEFLAAMPQPE